MRAYITDGNISVRRHQSRDVLALHEAVTESIPELTRWGFYRKDFTIEDAERDVSACIADWTEGKAFKYLIELMPGPVFVGNCGIAEYEPEFHRAALGWWVRTSRTGQGIATAAARLVAQAAFEDLHLRSLYIYVKTDNAPSRRVAEKIGAVLVRIKIENDGSCCAVYELRSDTLN